jgi:hypothetical protein
MSLVLKDRVRETATVVGTGDAALLGAVTGFQSFSVVGNTNTCYYTIADQSGGDWEVGIGTYSTTGPTLERTTVLASSNSGSKVSFTGGTKDVFLTYPSERAVYLDASGNLVIEGGATVDGNFVVNGNTTLGNATSDTVTITGTVQPGVVIEGSSSGNALRITQTGTGNALLVEDSANPDATPLVVTANGELILGNTSSVPVGGFGNQLQVWGTFGYTSQGRFTNDAGGARQSFVKSRSTSPGGFNIVQTNDRFGEIQFYGADGAAYISGASILAEVDGTPGTNDMPGRLVFSTTRDGASSPTEAMRIDNAGRVGIGNTASTQSLLIGGAAPASVTSGVTSAQQIPSSVTSTFSGFSSANSTAAASFTLALLNRYFASQGTIGAGSSITSQIGYLADSSLTGATNNYGFYSNIALGTGRWNFYAAGTAANYFAGGVTVAATAQTALSVTGGVNIGTSTATTEFRVYSASNWNYANANFTRNASNTSTPRFIGLPLDGDNLASTTIGEYNAIWGAYDSAPTTGSTSAALNGAMVYGAYAGHRWVTNGTERMRINSAGNVGINEAGSGAGQLTIGGTLVSASNITRGIFVRGTAPSTSTTEVSAFYSSPNTQAAAFTVPTLSHYVAVQGTLGAGSTVTNQIGFNVNSNLTGATNNYGFYSNIASGTGRYNFYAAGSADNYFSGNTGIGVVPNADNKLTIATNRATQVYGLSLSTFNGASFENSLVFSFNGTVQSIGNFQSFPLTFLTNNTERMRISSAGNVGIGGTPSATENLLVAKNLTGGTGVDGIKVSGVIQSSATSFAQYFTSVVSTAAASFTLPVLKHYNTFQGTIGAGSTITNQYGFFADSTLTGATNNFGFYSNIASGTGRYNFYAAGSADNYFAGNVNIGQTFGTNALTVGQSSAGTVATFLYNGSTGGGAEIRVSNGYSSTVPVYGFWYNNGTGVGNPAAQTFSVITAAAERMRIDSSGNLIQTAPTTAPTLSTNGTMVFNLTSDTNLRVSVRGSDGVTRTANITLA